MKFVDRIDETARLKDALARERSSLVGRRRFGKLTLIKRVLSDTDIYFLADRSESQYQRALFLPSEKEQGYNIFIFLVTIYNTTLIEFA